MKEGVIDVLMYIFSCYADRDDDLPEDRDGIDDDLMAAGFNAVEIDKAFDWLAGLAQDDDIPALDQSAHAMRIFAPQETERLAQDAQGFLIFLEQSGVLTPMLRELVINQVMALDPGSEVDEVDTEELKWVVMMVLFNSSKEQDEDTLMRYEDIVFAEQPAIFH